MHLATFLNWHDVLNMMELAPNIHVQRMLPQNKAEVSSGTALPVSQLSGADAVCGIYDRMIMDGQTQSCTVPAASTCLHVAMQACWDVGCHVPSHIYWLPAL